MRKCYFFGALAVAAVAIVACSGQAEQQKPQGLVIVTLHAKYCGIAYACKHSMTTALLVIESFGLVFICRRSSAVLLTNVSSIADHRQQYC